MWMVTMSTVHLRTPTVPACVVDNATGLVLPSATGSPHHRPLMTGRAVIAVERM
jgi:hypothetical protein